MKNRRTPLIGVRCLSFVLEEIVQDENKENKQELPGSEQGTVLDESMLVFAEESVDALVLQARLALAEEKSAELQDAYLRAKAEVENVRRRAQEDVLKAHKFAIESFAEGLLSVKDSLEMSLNVSSPSVESIREGVELTLRQLSHVFEKNRLTAVLPARGDKLDPMLHQALSTVPSDLPPNTVVEVLQKGYMLADRLIRPAIVIVAAGK